MNDQDRIVSSQAEDLILVDRNDVSTGHLSKALCHDGPGVLHRAFSLFLFNEAGELLLQQRGAQKRLWPGFWSNSCCSHPRRGESMEVATRRRLSDELNFETELEYVYHFCYTASFGDAGSENELCHVYLGNATSEIRPNRSEIESVRFLSPGLLGDEMHASPEHFTPWFKQEWEELLANHRHRLGAYCDVEAPIRR